MGPEHVLHCWPYLHTAQDDMGMYMAWPTAKVMDEGLYEEENQIAVGGKPYAVAIPSFVLQHPKQPRCTSSD